MFQGSQISRYFSRVGSGKLGVSGASSLSAVERSKNVCNFGAPINTLASGSEGMRIAISEETILGLQTGSVGYVRLYPTGDPRYVHETSQLPK
jgi:hypothetical protein